MESDFQSLHSEGVVAAVKHNISLISNDEEDTSWKNKVLRDHTPLTLIKSVVFL